MLDLHFASFGRGYLSNRTVWSELTVSCPSSRGDSVRGSTCCRPGLVRAHCQLSESTCIVTVILSQVSHAVTLALSEPTVSCQSPDIYLPWCCLRFIMLSPWLCQSAPSVVRVRTYSRCHFVRGFSCCHHNLLRGHCHRPESAWIYAMIFVRTHSRLSESRYVISEMPS
jgi:hypothetical protein